MNATAFDMQNGHEAPVGFCNARDFGVSGSRTEVTAHAEAGSRTVRLDEPGDFRVGQGVTLTGCNIHTIQATLWGPHELYTAARNLTGEVEYRGYDGSQGSWCVWLLDVDPACPEVFRWTDDFGRVWHEGVPITFDWQPLTGGIEVRFRPFEWEKGWTVALSACDLLTTEIEAIDGLTLTLRDPANRSCESRMYHNDSAAFQKAIDAALAAGKNLWIPDGYYRLASTLFITDAVSFTVQGESAERTIFDIGPAMDVGSKGGETRMENRYRGACFMLLRGREVTVRSLTMYGGMGFAERDQAGGMDTRGGRRLWGMYFKTSQGIRICDTERVLIENCHARRMSTEAFYSQGSCRTADGAPEHYTREITYLRCSAEDCVRNAFNNNDKAENTSLINCRITNVGGCSWEGASRFVRMTGCYVRNAGTVAMGNVRSRSEEYELLGTGQHIISDNVFESCCPYGGFMVRAAACATQVIIRHNLFVNFNSNAVEITGDTGVRDLPAENALITGNSFDMTAIDAPSAPRTAISVTAPDVTVSDNQIYVRGKADPNVTGISLRDDAMRLLIHDNLLRGCGTGIVSDYVGGTVGEAVSETVFARLSPDWGGTPSFVRRRSHQYRGWHLVWLTEDGRDAAVSVIDRFDPETCLFHLCAPCAIRPGQRFRLYNPEGTCWNLHDNTIYGSAEPLKLTSFGGRTALLHDNRIADGFLG